MALLAYLSLLVVIVGRDVFPIPVSQTIVLICLLYNNAKHGLCERKKKKNYNKGIYIHINRLLQGQISG
jgi:hypothetical protein